MQPVRNVITMDNIDDKIVMCKAITSIERYFQDRPFEKKAALYILIKTVKLKKPTPGRKREYIAEPLSSEQASRMFFVMLERGYIIFSHNYKPRPGEIAKIAIGEKMYKIGDLRMAECKETSWFKNRERKERFIQREEHIDKRSCRALQQIYTMFGNVPFTYKTVTETARMISKLADDKNIELNKAEIIALKHMKAKLYSYDIDSFRDIWQRLIRNNYIVPHKIKTPDGYIKTTGLYKINQPYLKHCLVEMI